MIRTPDRRTARRTTFAALLGTSLAAGGLAACSPGNQGDPVAPPTEGRSTLQEQVLARGTVTSGEHGEAVDAFTACVVDSGDTTYVPGAVGESGAAANSAWGQFGDGTFPDNGSGKDEDPTALQQCFTYHLADIDQLWLEQEGLTSEG